MGVNKGLHRDPTETLLKVSTGSSIHRCLPICPFNTAKLSTYLQLEISTEVSTGVLIEVFTKFSTEV